ncbi:MAG: phosphatidylglycerol lysyltransferase domain-containing protein [Pikeienuella sp.]|uniref:phosphatidylglycerol lysyltransferase domain-containing protein n=1 Tax=Pikeienuella sp. TaxID=2831957 RepID=UPI00391CCA73
MVSVSAVSAPRPRQRARLVAQAALAALSLALVAGLLHDRIAAADLSAALRIAGETGAGPLALAAAAAALSWAAVAGYDVLALGAVGMRLRLRRALTVGFTASGLGQCLGFGVLVGGAARWRMLRREGLGPVRAGKASLIVAGGFFGGLGAFALILALLLPSARARLETLAPGFEGGYAPAALALLAAAGALLLLRRRAGAAGCGLAFVALAAADVAPAAFALWALLPEGTAFEAVLVAYLAALTAGLLSNTPGGFGVFEGVLIAALPEAPLESILAAVIVFRVFFHGLPGLAAGALLLRAELSAQRVERAAPDPRLAGALPRTRRAEAALIHLGDKEALFSADGAAFLLVGARGRGLVALGDPEGPVAAWPAAFAALRRAARRRGRGAMIYRAGPRAAALAREAGFAAFRIGREAMIDPAGFDLAAPSRRRLRRKVRQAEGAGLSITFHEPGAAPLGPLRAISDAWLAAKGGGERGFSLGRFEPSWLRRFPILVAQDEGGRAVAFLSLWVSGDGGEWSIDLMRAGPEAPQGAMQALIVAAIGRARAAGARRFSLCMAPLSGLEGVTGPAAPALRRAAEIGAARRGFEGLAAFKASFDPAWRPCYALLPKGPGAVPALAALRGLARAPRG